MSKKDTRKSKLGDRLFKGLAVLCAIVILLVMAGFFVELVRRSFPAMKHAGFQLILSEKWAPNKDIYGGLGIIYGTLVSTAIAMIIASPLGLAVALFLTELAPAVVSRIVGTAIELLAAVPSIIYGMWGMFVFVPLMQHHVQPFLGETLGFLPLFKGPPLGVGMLTAGIILALMILPFISAVMRDVFHMVPSVMKESAYGMGATTWEVARKVLIPYGLQGLIGALFLGLGRAIGETMAVAFVIGNGTRVEASLFAPGSTIASHIANQFPESSDVFESALIELGLLLFLMTFLIQVAAHFWLRRIAVKRGAER